MMEHKQTVYENGLRSSRALILIVIHYICIDKTMLIVAALKMSAQLLWIKGITMFSLLICMFAVKLSTRILSNHSEIDEHKILIGKYHALCVLIIHQLICRGLNGLFLNSMKACFNISFTKKCIELSANLYIYIIYLSQDD